eukprot:GHVU01058277.1.p1 GENE.GHVU01058277.1~~GHVU01058277.1.p1  ORF type:complete len:123 (+),score=22.83 GHVU01058277.1:50-418(+)
MCARVPWGRLSVCRHHDHNRVFGHSRCDPIDPAASLAAIQRLADDINAHRRHSRSGGDDEGSELSPGPSSAECGGGTNTRRALVGAPPREQEELPLSSVFQVALGYLHVQDASKSLKEGRSE